MRFRKGNYEFSLLGPISAKKNLYSFTFLTILNILRASPSVFTLVRKGLRGLKTYPCFDLPSRSHMFGVVTALPFVRGGSLVLLHITHTFGFSLT